MTLAAENIAHAAEVFILLNKSSKLEHSWLAGFHCPSLNWKGEIAFDPETSDAGRTVLKEWLPKLITVMSNENLYSSSTTSMLVGLSAYGGPDYSPETESDAYALAFTVLYYINYYMPRDKMDKLAGPHVCTLLNAWLKPAEPWDDLPGVVTVCHHLFGDAWCALILPATFTDNVGQVGPARKDLDTYVMQNRPQLLPGLHRGEIAIAEEILPESVGVTI
jgi:hypothetical protein